MSSTTALILLLALPLVSAPVIYLIGRSSVRISGKAAPARWLAIAAILAAWVPLITAANTVIHTGEIEMMVGQVSLRMDGISLILAATALGLGLLTLIFSVPYMRGEEGEEKYYALLPAMIGSMVGLGCANDLFNLWVWFELMAVSSFLLVAFYTEDRGSLEAGIKYLVQSAVGSSLVLVGLSLIFAQTHTLRLDEMAAFSGPASTVTLAAGALFVIGFGVKTALVPMHTWLPDAHSQAPSGISAMLSGVVIEAGLIAMLRAVGNLPGGLPAWGILLLSFGAINMLVGNLMALRQYQVKRLLAYSSLAHVGYMLLGFGTAALFNTGEAGAGGFFHLVTHSMMKGLAFMSAGTLLFTLHIARGDHAPLTVQDLDGASKRYPLVAFGLSLAVLALGGLPPLAGFMSKWQIFAGAAETRSLPVILLIVFAALNSVLSLGYYAPLVNRMYRREPSAAVLIGRPVPVMMVVPVVLLIVTVTVLGFWPGLGDILTGPAASSLAEMFTGAIPVAGQ